LIIVHALAGVLSIYDEVRGWLIGL